ncbi:MULTISPECIES: membrane protein insertase YidC [Alteromonas]|jgi:YidC/Oxa1 family membrane protein insertase|uniref:membrane protein insertase YidC n=1 Tax=Alteromonas TaxID=226 RepID=UPI00066DD5E9|nr:MULTISPECIES: membrane protein insertase YidC [Alteromonas]MEC8450386.1 membrane protein insertase YidC [Pseudomonadota bacterium]MBC6985633.1 membrane protein insertase YidC [Alteromonas sp. BZK5]MCG7640288.1 membrane protein insertase YidC [Alteromonas sp. MmMcT2-2]MEC8904980.1 membrane protein insertase YidC [Pseudomonadota bacterium]MEC8965745.1 membrane protein insertase YidC [Pseudomonadota bacterium]
MESQRSFLIIGLALVSFLLWQSWQKDYGPQPVVPVEQQQTQETSQGVPSFNENGSEDVPSSDSVPAAQPIAAAQSSNRIIEVKTDTLDLRIDLLGGDVVSADLLKFPVEQGSDIPYSLLRSGNGLYVAQSGLIGAQGPDASSSGRPVYNAQSDYYEMTGDTLVIPLTWKNNQGLSVTKTFTFTKGQYDVNVSYNVENGTGSAATVQPYAQLKQVMEFEDDSNMFMPTYRGAAYSTEDDRYQKYSFDEIEDDNLRETTKAGWVGMLEHYFVSAWVPSQEQTNTLYSRNLKNQYAVIGVLSPSESVAPGETKTLASTLYMGPKDQESLAKIARGLDLTVDYGILFWISQPLFALLTFLHSLVNNWGVAIILITIVVKGAMYWLTKKQYESMARMRNLAPKMQQLKDRFGDDRQKMSQAMMELYRKEKVNPMGGCLPLLLQMPIFLALYWVLMESVELRHADFVLWITDLSTKDPYFVLPILTGASMYLLQKLQPTTITDPMQQKIMQWMPVAMSVFFLWFPAGLVLYWLVSNVITLVQAKMIYASMEKRGISSK